MDTVTGLYTPKVSKPCFCIGSSGAGGRATSIKDLEVCYTGCHKSFYQIASLLQEACQQSLTEIHVIHIGAMTGVIAAARKKVAWYQRNNNAWCLLFLKKDWDDRRDCFFKNVRGTGNNLPPPGGISLGF